MNQQAAGNPGGSRGGRWRIAGWSLAALLLALPLLAMQVTDEVAWTAGDFAIFGTMLALTGGGLELAARSRSLAHRAGAALAVLAAFLLVWGSLAVGVNGEGGPADLVYLAVLAVALVGAGAARFQSAGMARAMFATAAAQALAGAVSLAAGLAPAGAAMQVAGVNGAFAGLFLASALLFRAAARRQAAA